MIMGEYMDFETVLNDIYGNGLYHLVLLGLCSITGFITAIEIQTIIFMHYTPDFVCTDERLPPNVTISWISKTEFVNRHRHITDGNVSTTNKQCWGLFLAPGPNSTEPFACSQWTYTPTDMQNTVATQFDLVCDQRFWIPLMESAYLLFNAVGYILAFASDTFGRRWPFLLFTVWGLVISLGTPFVTSLPLLLFLRCCRGLSVALSYIGMTIISELVPMKYRAAYGNVYWITFAVGYMTTAGIAYVLRDWITIRLWSCLFLIVYAVYPFIVWESPRWLCSRGRRTEAVRILRRIAGWNQAKLPPDYFGRLDKFLKVVEVYEDKRHKTEDGMPECAHSDRCLDMLTHRNLRCHTLVLAFLHTAVVIVYFGIVIDGIFAVDDLFLNVFLMGLVELPSSLFGWLTSARFGRRLSCAVLLLLSALSVVMAKVAGRSVPALHTTGALAGKFFLSTAYCVADIYVTELYPTTIRNIGFFTVITVASVFSALAPFLNNLSQIHVNLPSFVYGSICLVAAIMAHFFLPETKSCPLAQTVADCDGFERGREKLWSQEMHQRYQDMVEDINGKGDN